MGLDLNEAVVVVVIVVVIKQRLFFSIAAHTHTRGGGTSGFNRPSAFGGFEAQRHAEQDAGSSRRRADRRMFTSSKATTERV